MMFEFTTTVEDLRESATPAGTARPIPRWVTAIGSTVFALFAVSNALPGTLSGRLFGQTMPRVGGPTGSPQNLWVTLAPSLFGTTWLMTSTILQLRLAARPIVDPLGRTAKHRGDAYQTTALLLAVTWFVVAAVPAFAILWHPTDTQALWATAVPWVVYTAALAMVMAGWSRRSAERALETKPSLGRPVTVNVSADGVSITDGVVAQHFRSPHFVRYRESANLLLLITEDHGVMFAPKRALPAADVDRLRGLIQTHVTEGTFLPRQSAFPVVLLAQEA